MTEPTERELDQQTADRSTPPRSTGEDTSKVTLPEDLIAGGPLRPLVSESVAETPVELAERKGGVRLARQHQQRIDAFPTHTVHSH